MQIRSTTEADRDAFVDATHAAFGRFPETPTDGGGLWWSALELDRGVLALADGRPVGTAAAYSLELTLPGGAVVPTAGITSVGVLATHRRQGVLSGMMRHQLAQLRARGEFLSVLLASEAQIYGRFGYGPATHTSKLTVQRHQSAFAVQRGGAVVTQPIELRRRADCGEILEGVYDRYRRQQPGELSRPPRWWKLGAGLPPIKPAPRFIGIHRAADETPDGYVCYAIEGRTLTVDEIVAPDDAVFAALAQFVLGHDLMAEVVFQHLPPENPLRWRFADSRVGELENTTDWLWVRLLDVPRALTARGWPTDGELVLDVDDPFLGEHHRYRLTTRGGRAECAPTEQEPDLSLDVRDLGSIYLGGVTPGELVRAGHIRSHRPDSAQRADALFRTERPPHCLHWF